MDRHRSSLVHSGCRIFLRGLPSGLSNPFVFKQDLLIWHAASMKPVFSSTESFLMVTSRTLFCARSASYFFSFFPEKPSSTIGQDPMSVLEPVPFSPPARIIVDVD